MPKGYRYVVLALVGLLIAASPPRGRTGSKQAQAEQATSDSLRSIAASLQVANELNLPDHGCPQSQDNRQSDLCAQWKAADAAANGSLWTERAFYLGIGGLLIGLLTLVAAGAAAKYARDAASETKRGADEAARSANSAVQANRSARAWIVHERTQHGNFTGAIDRTKVSDGYHFALVFRNVGQTPSLNTKIFSAHAVIGAEDDTGFFNRPNNFSDISSVVVPQGGPFSTPPVVLNDELWPRFKRQEIHVILYALIEYIDVFSDQQSGAIWRTTELCMRAIHQGGEIEEDGRRSESITFVTRGPQNQIT